MATSPPDPEGQGLGWCLFAVHSTPEGPRMAAGPEEAAATPLESTDEGEGEGTSVRQRRAPADGTPDVTSSSTPAPTPRHNPFPDIALVAFLLGLGTSWLVLLAWQSTSPSSLRACSLAGAAILGACALEYHTTCLVRLPPRTPAPLPHAVWVSGHLSFAAWAAAWAAEWTFK